jgi:hypothetical protein
MANSGKVRTGIADLDFEALHARGLSAWTQWAA